MLKGEIMVKRQCSALLISIILLGWVTPEMQAAGNHIEKIKAIMQSKPIKMSAAIATCLTGTIATIWFAKKYLFNGNGFKTLFPKIHAKKPVEEPVVDYSEIKKISWLNLKEIINPIIYGKKEEGQQQKKGDPDFMSYEICQQNPSASGGATFRQGPGYKACCKICNIKDPDQHIHITVRYATPEKAHEFIERAKAYAASQNWQHTTAEYTVDDQQTEN
jgi:hypothetical protein